MKKASRDILWYFSHDTRSLFWMLLILGWCAIEALNYIKYGKM